MPRCARAVAVGYPHHVTQRGNSRAQVFFDDQDRQTYLQLLQYYTRGYRIEVQAFCLMPNHVHLLVIPREQNDFGRGIGLTNQCYTAYINRKYLRSGRVWQNRFYSCIVDTDEYLWGVARYIENNPLKAGLVASAEEYPWSSARYHICGEANELLAGSELFSVADRESYRLFLSEHDEQISDMIRKATQSGRPLCNATTLLHLEQLLGRLF